MRTPRRSRRASASTATIARAAIGEELRNTSAGVTFDLRRLRAGDQERFLDAVLNGKRQMPPWRGALQMEQIEAIWAYIRAKVDR